MSETTASFDIVAGKKFTFRVKSRALQILEMEDVLFRHNSAVFLPDREDFYSASNSEDRTDQDAAADQEKMTGLSVLKSILLYALDNPEKKILIAGHTDASGSNEINFKISEERADSVLYLIENKRDEWAKISHNRHKDEDIQHILTWVARQKGWDCDPGGIDGKTGPKTRQAIKNFQSQAGTNADGIVGPRTWGKIFDIYQEELALFMDYEKGKQALDNRGALNWLYSDNKAVGCGESWPKEHVEASTDRQLRSQTNRRVEILFFDEDEIPPECQCKKGVCETDACPIYPAGKFTREYIPAGPPQLILRIKPLDQTFNPLPGKRYALTLGNTTYQGDIPPGGVIRHLIPDNSIRDGVLEVWQDNDSEESSRMELIIVNFQPVSQVQGIKKRLRNLNYYSGEFNDAADDIYQNALCLFQEDNEMERTGCADADTVDKLRQVYGA